MVYLFSVELPATYPIVFLQNTASTTWPNCIALASSLELAAHPKGLASPSRMCVCSHVCVCYSVLKRCMFLRTLSGSARCLNTLSCQSVLQRTSARQPWQPLSRQNQKWCRKFNLYEKDAQRKVTHLFSLQHLGKITILSAARQPWQPWLANVQK